MRTRFALLILSLPLLLALSGCEEDDRAAVAGPDVDLDRVVEEFASFSKSGSQDAQGFCQQLTERGVYTGGEPLECELQGDGKLVGYVNRDGAPGYGEPGDALKFKVEVEEAADRRGYVVASDAYGYHQRSLIDDFLTIYLLSHMLDLHRSSYGPGYRHPYQYSPRGYYEGVRRSVRAGSAGSRWGRSGGLFGGK